MLHQIKPARFKAFTVDVARLQSNLSRAPMEFADKGGGRRPVEITLPKPDGTFARFHIEEVALMEPKLAAKFPEIRTYRGRDVNDPLTSLQLDVNAETLHAQVLSPSGAYYIDPYWHRDGSLYMSYAKKDLTGAGRHFKCLVDGKKRGSTHAMSTQSLTELAVSPENASSGQNLRTYRLAIATSLRYSQYHGGTPPNVAQVIAALVTLNNRVSGVYETEFGIRMILVGDEDLIVATATNPTPYTDTPGDIQSNPLFIDQKIGEANYDIGHVVTVGSGGIAGLGVVCRGFDAASGGSAKAAGTTGIDPPEGDGFWIDFVAHEMGHQFGGNHTFDGADPTNCTTNANASTAYEPGSGTTIQAYAGVCGDQNLQPHSDPYWHFVSLQEMFGYASGSASRIAPGILLQKTDVSRAAPPAPDATPTSGTLNPTGPNVTWTGTATPGTPPSNDESTCVDGVNCDTFTLTVGGQPADWVGKTVRITFNWPGAADDYDIYVHKGGVDGPIVDDAVTGNNPEVINFSPNQSTVGTGTFTVHVVYFAVVFNPLGFQYNAVASAIGAGGGGGNPTCAVLTATGNNPPTVNAGPDFKIPARTPFALTASGTDPDGDPLTYCWEEADLAPGAKDANAQDDGANPIFRSFPPTTSTTRIFPQLSDLLLNRSDTIGEHLPITTRELNFVVTGRDNKFGGFGQDSTKINVIDSGQGFAVTAPNTGIIWSGGSAQNVTWNVANTTGPEISTTNVNIWLSLDGGQSFHILLAGNTPNDGSEPVTVPYVNNSTARVKVEAVGNIYFDISNANFTIQSVDHDSDGIPDGFETANGLNPNNPADAALDADGDGQSNKAEFIAGTNLHDATSVLRVTFVDRTNESAVVTFTSVPGKRYQIEASPDLSSWSAISGDIFPTGNTETYNDASAGKGDVPFRSIRFYRARVFN
ncbi:MAG TPA: M12 family metallo-peptidase [Verrucomicrobiae bacterium]|nr:M12 family metallo-peptidase [Verrucomicrobiae bacterium]